MKTLNSIYNFFKGNEKLLLYIALLLCVVFWNRSCTDQVKTKTIKVDVPEQKGSFELNPDILQWPVISKDSIVYRTVYKDSIIEVENQVNTQLAEDYKALQSEFDRYKLFLEAIKIQNYSKTFDDDLLSAKVTGTVQGEIQNMALDYTLKPRTIETDIEVKNYRWVIGPQVGVTYMNEKFVPYVGLGLSYRLIRF